MPAEQFRLNTLLHGISDDGRKRSILDLPAGAVVTASRAIEPGDQLVEVHWQGQEIFVFATDLRERAERVESGRA